MEELDLYYYLNNLETKDIVFLLRSNNYNGNNIIKLREAINTLLNFDIIDLYLPLASDKTKFREMLLFKRRIGTLYFRIRGKRELKPVKEKEVILYTDKNEKIEKEEVQPIFEQTNKVEEETHFQPVLNEVLESLNTLSIKDGVVYNIEETVKRESLGSSSNRGNSMVEHVLVQTNDGATPDKELSYVEKSQITLQPYPYQQRHVKELIHIFKDLHNVAFNGSDPGTGKTLTTLELARAIGFTVLCICPASVQEQWRKEIVKYGVPCYSVSTYDILVKAKWTPIMKDGSLAGVRPFPNDESFPYVTYSKKVFKNENKTMKKDIYEWHLPPATLVVMDESKTIKNKGTKRYNMCNSLIKYLNTDKGKTSRLLLLSATAIESDRDLKSFLFTLGYIKTPSAKALKSFLNAYPLNQLPQILYEDKYLKRGVMINTIDAKEELKIKINSEIIPIIAIFGEEEAKKIEEENLAIAEIIKEDKEKSKKDPKFGSDPIQNRLAAFSAFTRARQTIETIKLPAMFEYARKLISEGYKTLIFVRFIKSIQFLIKELGNIYGEKNIGAYYGEISKKDRLKIKDDFNAGKLKCLVVSLQAGAEGINLHDTSKGGKLPRASVLNPDPLLGTLYQALGRIDRISATSNSKQYLIFADTETERKFATKLRQKDSIMKLLHGARNLTLADI